MRRHPFYPFGPFWPMVAAFLVVALLSGLPVRPLVALLWAILAALLVMRYEDRRDRGRGL